MQQAWLGPVAALPLLLVVTPARAQVSATAGAGSLGSLVNGVAGGSCGSGLCVVGGGTAAGSNLFHRLDALNTQGAISGVRFDNAAMQNLIVGVTNPYGSVIDKAVSLSNPANFVLLSPGGIHLGPGAGFIGVQQLGLSTATRMAMTGGGSFDVFSTTAQQAAAMAGAPLLGASSLQVDAAARSAAGIAGVPGIVAQGITITIDRDLLIDAVDGTAQINGSQLAVLPWQGVGGSLSVLGREVLVEGASTLLATGPAGGGLIQLGGSWQNSNPEVRQALRTAFGAEALVDASATERGNGGTVVVWSEIGNPLSLTTALGTLHAKGAGTTGNGGKIETSGATLFSQALKVDASSGALGLPGL
ncbi:MAG: filamentous hemagglutinin, partial [Cyanobacteria bacterium REEB417]|nr:filamentous hemagglutinin [Cyanobacteria bacterium REEB417]